eukprot:Sdes_comp23706_c0_seq1m21880
MARIFWSNMCGAVEVLPLFAVDIAMIDGGEVDFAGVLRLGAIWAVDEAIVVGASVTALDLLPDADTTAAVALRLGGSLGEVDPPTFVEVSVDRRRDDIEAAEVALFLEVQNVKGAIGAFHEGNKIFLFSSVDVFQKILD